MPSPPLSPSPPTPPPPGLPNLQINQIAVVALALTLGHSAYAGDCVDIGLSRASRVVLQIREAGHSERPAVTYRDANAQAWFVALRGDRIGEGRRDRQSCTLDNVSYWRLPASDPSLTHDANADVLSFLDIDQPAQVIDGRKPALQEQSVALSSVGLNYQLALNYAARRLTPSAFADLYAYRDGWYFDTSFGWSNNAKVSRYETYALKESLDTGLFLRLGDSTSSPTALGEALQFAGVSWGTDRSLRQSDFSPVLPSLRNGNVLSGPIEVFINDTLGFQQTLQSGVYDLRNIPAQQGFNSYTVRTIDAQGNPVTVQREIYLPAALLPPGISSWRVDAGFQREDFFSSNARYGSALVAANYSTGLTHDITVGGHALVSKAASSLSADYDQRLSALWAGHLGLIAGKNSVQEGRAVQARLDGGSRWWRLLADWTHAFKPLPGLGSRAALLKQRLLRAQWSAIPGWNLGATLVQSQRESTAREQVISLTASTRIPDSATSLVFSLVQTEAAGAKQNNITVSLFMPLFMPLAPADDNKNRSVYASHSNVDGASFSRAQYSSSGQTPQESSWTLGATHGSRPALTSLDANWTKSTEKLELMASGRTSPGDNSGLISMRSGLLWTGGSMFTTRPVTGAFALVSTGQPGVEVQYENRPAGRTDERGMLLVPSLLALELNRLSVNPANWPIQWTASQTEQLVIPPRGGGVLVSFKINAQTWPAQSLIKPVTQDGKPFPAGTVVQATVNGDLRETVIDRRGQLWIGELLPASVFSITYAGRRCAFSMPSGNNGSDAASVTPAQCEDQP